MQDKGLDFTNVFVFFWHAGVIDLGCARMGGRRSGSPELGGGDLVDGVRGAG